MPMNETAAEPPNEWVALMADVRQFRSGLIFSKRLQFDDALRPPIKGSPGKVIAYPDAVYHITAADVLRAKEAV